MRQRTKTRKWVENILLLCGLLAVNVWVWSIAFRDLYESWQNWTFDREIHGRSVSVAQFVPDKAHEFVARFQHWAGISNEPSSSKGMVQKGRSAPMQIHVAENELVGRLTVARLGIRSMVREGAGEETLHLSLGHIPGTAFPGQSGNVGIAGHRDAVFRALRDVKTKDLIEVETVGGKYVYSVESTQIVNPSDVSVLNAASYPELTLVTCYPFYYVGSAPDRFIVKARQITPPAAHEKRILVSSVRSGNTE